MLRVAVAFLLLAAVVCAVDLANAEEARFREVLTLPDGRRVVIEENTLEPRSVGSYSVRLYSGRDPQFPYDDFVAGIVVPRHGIIESARLIQARDGKPLAHVILRSVGSGSYASHHWLTFSADSIEMQEGKVGILPGLDYSETPPP